MNCRRFPEKKKIATETQRHGGSDGSGLPRKSERAFDFKILS